MKGNSGCNACEGLPTDSSSGGSSSGGPGAYRQRGNRTARRARGGNTTDREREREREIRVTTGGRVSGGCGVEREKGRCGCECRQRRWSEVREARVRSRSLSAVLAPSAWARAASGGAKRNDASRGGKDGVERWDARTGPAPRANNNNNKNTLRTKKEKKQNRNTAKYRAWESQVQVHVSVSLLSLSAPRSADGRAGRD